MDKKEPRPAITVEEWSAKGEALFGKDRNDWKFKCPSCGHVQSVKECRDAGVEDGDIAFSCIGRWTGSDKSIFDKTGGPCNYAGFGLFRINPVRIMHTDGKEYTMFDFAEDTQ